MCIVLCECTPWRPQVDIKVCLPQLLLPYWIQSSRAPKLVSLAGILSSPPMPSSHHWGFRHVQTYPAQLLGGCWRSKLRPSCLHSECLNQLSHLSSPRETFFCFNFECTGNWNIKSKTPLYPSLRYTKRSYLTVCFVTSSLSWECKQFAFTSSPMIS